MAYFKYFNKINYDVRGVKNNVNFDVITNILERVRLKLNFIHEETLNDAKRNLTVIRPEYVGNVVNEFKKLLK